MYYWGDEGWNAREALDAVRWHVFDDRAMYRPGEEVHLKGWVRQIGGKQDGDVALLPGATSVRYQVIDPQGNQLADETHRCQRPRRLRPCLHPARQCQPGLCRALPVGHHRLPMSTARTTITRSRFRSSADRNSRSRPGRKSEGPYFVGDDATVSVHASYFAGGPLPNAETNWNVTASPGSYSPPNWPDFTFGVWTPWWGYYEPYYDPYSDSGYTYSQLQRARPMRPAHTI